MADHLDNFNNNVVNRKATALEERIAVNNYIFFDLNEQDKYEIQRDLIESIIPNIDRNDERVSWIGWVRWLHDPIRKPYYADYAPEYGLVGKSPKDLFGTHQVSIPYETDRDMPDTWIEYHSQKGRCLWDKSVELLAPIFKCEQKNLWGKQNNERGKERSITVNNFSIPKAFRNNFCNYKLIAFPEQINIGDFSCNILCSEIVFG